MSDFINGRPVKLRVIVFGEPDSGKSRMLEVIKRALDAEGIQYHRGVESDDVESILLTEATP